MDDPTFPERRHVLESDCDRCPGLDEHRTCIAWGNGPLDADVMVIGEAPAAGDADADRWRGGNLTGYAYTSRHSGRRVRRLMRAAGVAERAYYTNAVKCFPRDETVEGETNREPTDEELANCRGHLRTELDCVAPRVVCPTGKHATNSALALADESLDGFLDAVLEPREVALGETGTRGGADSDGEDDPVLDESVGRTTVLPLLHPSYQDVWRARLGYDDGEYVAAIGDAIAGLLED